MKIILGVSLIVFIIILLLLFRFWYKRTKLYFRLKKYTKENGYSLKIQKMLFWLPKNNYSKSNLVIESNSTVYSIKLFGLLRSSCAVHFWNENEYSAQKYLTHRGFIVATPLGKKDIHHRKLGKTDFSKSVCEESKHKRIVPIMLISPVNSILKLTKTAGLQVIDLSVGDKIGNILFADRIFLFSVINNQEKRDF